MPAQTVTCDRCGAVARVLATSGLIQPDPRWPDAKIVHEIDCPHCGLREQPTTIDRA